MNRPTILLLGNTNRPEFQAARVRLEMWAAVSPSFDVDSALVALREGEIVPDLIVIAQAFPGEFSRRAVDRLRQLAPVARIVGLLGSWCEGEMRTGAPWPATARLYWHQWPTRCERELHQLMAGQSCSWALPATATEDDRVLARLCAEENVAFRSAKVARDDGPCARENITDPALLSRSERRQSGHPCPRALIRSNSKEMADWLAAACRSRGFIAVVQHGPDSGGRESVDVAIFDDAGVQETESDALRQLVAAVDPAPVIALLSFPRFEHQAVALDSGAAAVLSKPIALDDLFWQIEAVSRTPAAADA
jgi:hypothetical protein